MKTVLRMCRISTRARITAAVIALAVVPLLIIAAVSLSQQRSAALADTYDELEGLAETQVAHLEGIVEADIEIAEIVASNDNVRLAITTLAIDQSAIAQVRQGLSNAVLASDRLINISLYDTEGAPLASFDEGAPDRYAELEIGAGFESLLAQVIVGRRGAPAMLTSALVYDGTKQIGMVVVESDAEPISELAATYLLLSETSETSVAQPIDTGAQFIAPLRFKDDAVMKLTVPSSNAKAPISLAMAGYEGRFGETVDYRDEAVLAVTRHMDSTGWGIVVKIDKSEALAGVDEFRNTMMAALAVVVLLVLVLSLAIGQSIWRPVRELTATAAAVAGGDLSRRADVESDGEIGELARAVNSMTDDLVNAAEGSKVRRLEMEQVNRKLATSEEELNTFFENAVDGLVVVDADGVIHRMNRAGQVLFDVHGEAVKGLPITSLLSADGVAPNRLFEIAARDHDGIEMTAANHNGHTVPVHVAVSRIEVQGEFWYTGAIRDMSDRRAMQERLRHLAHHDDVTGLPNRACLREVLEESLQTAEGSNEKVGLLFLDLDQFKLVNDSRGHAAGDQLLRGVGARLLETLRNDEKVARFGGDEFVVLSPRINEAVELEVLAQRVHAAFEEPVDLDGELEHVSMSIGAAMSFGGTDPDTLISNADVAMYRAKDAGRSRTVLFDAEMRGQVEARHQLESALRLAVEADEVQVHYQPIVKLDSGEICGVESLARWNRPGHGPVSPGEFIPVAEDSGLIVPLGLSIFRKVCEQQVAWREERPDSQLRLTINMSSRQLMQPECVESVRRVLRETGADPEKLLIEVTESVLTADIELAARRLEELRKLGLAIAVDDFGTGYSSLTYLREFPLDAVKIDRSFMSELEDSAVESSIVSLVVGLGRSLGIQVIAEGVETEGQLRALRELGCESGQGFLFARPQPADEVARLLWPDFESAADITVDAA